MTNRRLLLSMLVLCLGVSAIIGIRASGATYTKDSTTGAKVLAANDWTPPAVTVTNPGETVSGTITVSATATDVRGTVASVELEYRAAGASPWTALCTDTSSPWSCAWNTSGLVDGSYELRAIATDDSGNRGTSATVATEVTTDRGYVSLGRPDDVVSGTVTLRATTSLGWSIVSHTFEYAPAGTSRWTTICTTSTLGWLTANCSWDTSALTGTYDLRVRTSSNTNGSAVSVVRDVLVDNTDPTATLTVPTGLLSGTVQLGAQATDAHSGLANVSIQSRAAGGNWTSCGTGTTSPFTCSFDTTKVLDGSYEFRAVANDRAGNQTTTATATRTVTNVAGTVTITSPTPGSTVRGTAVTVSAATTANRGVASVRFEVKPAGSSSWIFLCTDSTRPYSCTANSTDAPQGAFEIRAVMTDNAGFSFASDVVRVTIDNTPPRAHDVQATNGGTLGQADGGDKLVLTFSDEVALSSIKSGWTGGSTQVSPTLYDSKADGSANPSKDNLVLSGTNLGLVSFGQDYVKDRAVVSYGNSNMQASTATVNGATVTVITITLGTPSKSKDLAAANNTLGAMIWTPGSGLLSPDGLGVSTTPATESGSNDRDF